LSKLLSECDIANGLLNRFMLVCCKRSKLLPFGGCVPQADIDRLTRRLADAVAYGHTAGEIGWTKPAMALWEREYGCLTAARPGAYGMATSRAEAHTIRLALLYALFDQSGRIEPPHLAAALAVWCYCQRSAAHIFGDRTGDRDADKILHALRATPGGMAQHEIRRGQFNDNKPAALIAEKLALLARNGLVRCESSPTAGRTATRWFAVAQNHDVHVINVESPPPTPLADPPTLQADPYHVNHVHVTPEREIIEL
jgi:hypothetical protein